MTLRDNSEMKMARNDHGTTSIEEPFVACVNARAQTAGDLDETEDERETSQRRPVVRQGVTPWGDYGRRRSGTLLSTGVGLTRQGSRLGGRIRPAAQR